MLSPSSRRWTWNHHPQISVCPRLSLNTQVMYENCLLCSSLSQNNSTVLRLDLRSLEAVCIKFSLGGKIHYCLHKNGWQKTGMCPWGCWECSHGTSVYFDLEQTSRYMRKTKGPREGNIYLLPPAGSSFRAFPSDITTLESPLLSQSVVAFADR